MRILVVEDDALLRESLKRGLTAEGYVVDTAEDGENGSYIARTNTYSLIVLDYMLPSKNGDEICRELREKGVNTPIIITSVRSEIPQKVELFKAGADDYLCKPYSFLELIARIKTLMKRPYAIQNAVMTLDDLTIDIESQQVDVSGERVYLTRKEFMLLGCMARKCGKVISRTEIMEEVWNNDSDPFSNTVEAHIRNLRKKLEIKNNKRFIHTIPGRGYKLDRMK